MTNHWPVRWFVFYDFGIKICFQLSSGLTLSCLQLDINITTKLNTAPSFRNNHFPPPLRCNFFSQFYGGFGKFWQNTDLGSLHDRSFVNLSQLNCNKISSWKLICPTEEYMGCPSTPLVPCTIIQFHWPDGNHDDRCNWFHYNIKGNFS